MSENIITPESVTLKKAAEAYLESIAAAGAKPTTANIYKKALGIAIDYFGENREISSLTLLQTGKYFASPAVNMHPDSDKPKAEATVRQIKRVFRQCLEYAKTQGWLADPLPIPRAEMEHARSKSVKPEPVIGPRLRGQDFMPVVKHEN